MKNLLNKSSVYFAAGALGGLINSLALWLLGKAGITAAVGVKLAPVLKPMWLYPRIVWGGIWGFIFLLPFLRGNLALKGLFLSLAPTAVQLFWVFPYKLNAAFFGLKMGTMTPLVVLVLNAIWGVSAAFLIWGTEK